MSVITYQDGTAELEVLHAGPPRRSPEDTRPGLAAAAWTVSVASAADLDDAVAVIRDLIRLAAIT